MSDADFVVVGSGSHTRERSRRRRIAMLIGGGRAALITALSVALLGSVAAASAHAAPPSAAVQPISVAGTRPLGSAVVDLSARGYREDEYYASGTANRYRFTSPTTNASVIDGGWSYKTRMLVRRPTNPKRFNGTVVVEWLNVSTSQDIDFVWHATHDHLMREGYAWVGITAQRFAIDKLRSWSPQRYGSLSGDASNVDPATGAVLDPPSGASNPVGGDVLSWDIFGQAAQALRSHAGADPLRGLDVRRVIAAGESQSATRLTRYYNGIQPLHNVFDGFLYYDAAGALRSDLRVPAISMQTEWWSSVNIGRESDPRAPDTAFLRRWYVAGSSHVSLDEMRFIDAMILRDQSLRDAGGSPVSLTQLITGCRDYPLWSTVPSWIVVTAALEHLNDWLVTGRPAPTGPRFEVDTTTTPPTLKRDAGGQVLGGIRLPQFVTPTAENRAINFGPGFCTLTGSHRFYAPSELRSRYRNHGRYVAQVVRSTFDVARDGFILPYDAISIVKEAAHSSVGR